MSAGLSAPKTFRRRKSPLRRRSCTQSCPTARCRTLPIPVRRQMPMAALLSAPTSSCKDSPRSAARLISPRPSAAPLTMPANSASPELRAMTF
eukprot:2653551-Lingulodinium_polyedra.AAC.1